MKKPTRRNARNRDDDEPVWDDESCDDDESLSSSTLRRMKQSPAPSNVSLYFMRMAITLAAVFLVAWHNASKFDTETFVVLMALASQSGGEGISALLKTLMGKSR